MFPTLPADHALLLLLNQDWRAPALDLLLPVFSLRSALFVILSGLMVWRCRKHGKSQALYFMLMVLAMGLTDLTTNQVKHAVGRLRPENAVGGTYRMESEQWLRLPADMAPDRERGTSFPSAHAANSAALAFMAAMLWPRLRRGIWALPLLVGWSRIYMGKHYPTDVLGGWLLGLLMGWLFWRLWQAVAKHWRLQLRAEPAEE
ncbi:MAG: phosphatase PAP2 family protein [Humidesulfovibrio sp.]|nr:phosphatase PAP2 family protein [Humidesulfovibrio sp.]